MTKKTPTVSVLIPTYNQKHMVGWAIQSMIGGYGPPGVGVIL